EKFGKFVFELFVYPLSSADEADAGQSVSPLIQGVFGSGGHGWMLRQSQIIVGAHVEHWFAIRHADSCALGRNDDPLVFECAGTPDVRELPLEVLLKGIEHFSASSGALCPIFR